MVKFKITCYKQIVGFLNRNVSNKKVMGVVTETT